MGSKASSKLQAGLRGAPPYLEDALAPLVNSRCGAQARRLSSLRSRLRSVASANRFGHMTGFEREAFTNGFAQVAGVDEAGRGPLAGPIVAGAVILAGPVPGLDDSKRLSPNRREELFALLTSGRHAFATSVIGPEAIDKWGIQVANYRAMAEAAAQLDPSADFLLVDGFELPCCLIPQKRIVKGDRLSVSIAAASIIAKVWRDRIMMELDGVYPEYGFAKHKGYGTRLHLDALRRLGPCPAHRRSFVPVGRRCESACLFENVTEGGETCD